jgi:transcriptional regulator GlxA family with amidase domain
VLEDQVLIQWLRNAAPGCQWTVSVCTGASLYAAAGLLDGKKTSTHWAFRDVVGALGAEVVEDRVVWQANHVSGAGVSAGIDVALALTERVHGEELAKALQLVIEYDPEPPFDSGSPSKADRQTKRLAEQVLLAGQPRLKAMAQGVRTIIKARRFKRGARELVPPRGFSAPIDPQLGTSDRKGPARHSAAARGLRVAPGL